MPNKELECITPNRLREDVAKPLSLIADDVFESAQQFEDAIQSGLIEKPCLEMNLKRLWTALTLLKSINRKEIQGKLADAIAGTYRWRKQVVPKAHCAK